MYRSIHKWQGASLCCKNSKTKLVSINNVLPSQNGLLCESVLKTGKLIHSVGSFFFSVDFANLIIVSAKRLGRFSMQQDRVRISPIQLNIQPIFEKKEHCWWRSWFKNSSGLLWRTMSLKIGKIFAPFQIFHSQDSNLRNKYEIVHSKSHLQLLKHQLRPW